MEIKAGSDLILILKLQTPKGREFRVKDCQDISVTVFTDNVKAGIEFGIDDIDQGEKVDKLLVSNILLETLNSGVIQYSYTSLSKDQDLHLSRTVATNIYFKNPVKIQDDDFDEEQQTVFSEWLLDKFMQIKKEVDGILAENGEKLDEVESKLIAEITRSTEEDEEFRQLLSSFDPDEIEEQIKQLMADYITSDDAEKKYQPKGDYALRSEIPTDYLTENDLEKYALKSDIPTDFYTQKEVDDKISQIDVKDQLGDYVTNKSLETKLQPYATKEEILKLWSGSQDEYNSIGSYDANTVYIIIS